MEVGSFIRIQRIEQSMTQGELSDGIISTSYLSKIENKQTEASHEVINLLYARLGVEAVNVNNDTIKEMCEEWYKLLFEINSKEEIISRYKEIQKLMDTVNSDSTVMFEVYKLRYYLILKELENAEEQMEKLNQLSETFDGLHRFYLFRFKGDYHFSIGNFNQTLYMYKAAASELNKLSLVEVEIADLHYTTAVTHSKLLNTLESINYANSALKVFKEQYSFLRCAQCHVLLGIAFKRMKMYEKSIKNYNLAKRLGELKKSKQIIQLTNYNLANLHSDKGEPEEAIYYYAEVVNDEEVNINTRLTAVTSLIKEYYSISSIAETKCMLQKALGLLPLAEKNIYYKLYHYIIYTYNYAVKEERVKFEELVAGKFIPYLEKQQDYSNLVFYANMLGAYFEKSGKYKKSVKYYKLANGTYKKLVYL